MEHPPGELTITGTAQREAWLRRVMPPVEQLEADLWSLPVPIPGNPLRYVSVYASELLAAIRQRPGSTPWQLAGHLTWSRPWDQYGGQMRIFAVTETAAHAHLLERRGLVTASRTRPPAYTARAA